MLRREPEKLEPNTKFKVDDLFGAYALVMEGLVCKRIPIYLGLKEYREWRRVADLIGEDAADKQAIEKNKFKRS